MHIVLLGDSVFDNAPYTAGGPAVVDHLNALVREGEEATLLAVDGDCLEDMPSQQGRIPDSATHIIVSIGGNDALGHADLLNAPVRTAGQGLAVMGGVVDDFAERYRALLGDLCRGFDWLQVCTIYNGDFGPEAPVLSAAVRLFDDAIQRAANEWGVLVIELRDLLNEPIHYANPIEPSVEGGRVLAEEILRRARG